ncbi:CHAT domain-containing protein [Streptomyces sp. TS71-3]|uniref:CHAT domain-containing protein n=1 Tax=Streptomyces sp. TS71-3 TaxID=2733862 RepID=UPI00201744BA|nr:CHAT domain-containing protein [Streptomyces sp. TS71-3]
MLAAYLDAASRRSRHLADPAVQQPSRAAADAHWQETLDKLCDWAWGAAVGPVLAALDSRDRPPRIVLVPCGRLGVIPWHAARTPRGPDGGSGPVHRYACQEAVISYAPSGGQFLRAAARERIPVGGRTVLVNDPDMVWTDIETEELHTACYPDALRYGDSSADGTAGTPNDLLTVLPGGSAPASVLHIACHALTGPSPTRSALQLAAPPGGDREAGRLTVARILDASTTEPRYDHAPLVVLSACETDLTTRDHDEALTLAAALVVRGAGDVVGSRWSVDGASTALMMAVFHYFRTARSLSPPDALRETQLWMLDPDRTPPPTLHDPVLRREATRTDLHHVHHWAAFTHQGNPAATGDWVSDGVRAAKVSLQLGDFPGAARSMFKMGMFLQFRGRFEEAARALASAAETFGKVGDRHGEGVARIGEAVARNQLWLSRHADLGLPGRNGVVGPASERPASERPASVRPASMRPASVRPASMGTASAPPGQAGADAAADTPRAGAGPDTRA